MPQSGMTADSSVPSLGFSLVPEPSHLLRARERIRDYLRQHCADEGLVSDVVLCIEEAATNAIRHSGSDRDIDISLHFSDGDLLAKVKDHGRGFDLATFDRETLPDVLSDHGRGLFIVAKLMDLLELSLDGGLEVRMTRQAKRLCEGSSLESALVTMRDGAELDRRDMRLRALLEEIDEAFIAFDWDYRHVYLNEVAARMAGKPREEMIGYRPWDLWPDYEGSSAGIALRRAMELGRPSIIEHRSLATGNWQETRVYPTPAGVSMYVREINERKRTEQELVATRASLTATLAAITDGFYTLDRMWHVTYLNDKAAAVFPGGREALGADFWELFPADVGSSYEAGKRRAMERGEVYSFEFYDPRFDTWFEERDYPGADGITVLFTDITARKQAEEEQREAARFDKALAAIEKLVHSSLDFTEVMQTALREASTAIGAETAGISMHDDEAHLFRVAYAYNYPEDKLGILIPDRDDTRGVEAMRTGRTLTIDDTQSNARGARELMDAWSIKSAICAPLIVRGHAVAVASFNYHAAAHRFSEQEIEFVTELASRFDGARERPALRARGRGRAPGKVLNEINVPDQLDA